MVYIEGHGRISIEKIRKLIDDMASSKLKENQKQYIQGIKDQLQRIKIKDDSLTFLREIMRCRNYLNSLEETLWYFQVPGYKEQIKDLLNAFISLLQYTSRSSREIKDCKK